jgi:hypothetical protein
MRILITILFAGFFVAACSTTETHTLETDFLVLTAEGPLFEGNNTATLDWKADDAFWGENLRAEDIKSAKVSAAKVEVESADGGIRDVTIQLAGQDLGMQKIAFFDEDGNVNLASKQENLASFFTDSYPTVVADFDLAEDFYDDLEIRVKLRFEVEAAAK